MALAAEPNEPNCSTDNMARRKKLILTQPVKEGLKAIKVRLDARTIITIASMKALEFWKQRYPNLQVIG
jgi:hypothetical protein